MEESGLNFQDGGNLSLEPQRTSASEDKVVESKARASAPCPQCDDLLN